MKIYRTTRSGSFIGVLLKENTLIIVYSNDQWSTNNIEYRDFRFYGDIVAEAGDMLEFLADRKIEVKDNKRRVLKKIAIMWERQPYMLKKKGITESSITKKTEFQKILDELAVWEAGFAIPYEEEVYEEDFNFLTR